MHPKDISIQDYTYTLPEDKIALHPAHPRDSSRLLIYKDGRIEHSTYHHLNDFLPSEACLVFNDTRVINSRILFRKKTGAIIEIFCLEPFGKFPDYTQFLSRTKNAQWKCMIGKASKWKDKFLEKDLIIGNQKVKLKAELIDRLPDAYVVELSWTPEEISHGEIIHTAGNTPLPPYIKREAGKQDEKDYQTVYSTHEGSVAAPTAGLHFTSAMMEQFKEKDISTLFTTLHVGAGTFKPVKSATMDGHIMHEEWMVINNDFLGQLKSQLSKPIISVGTTAARTLESIFWMGNKILNQPDITEESLKISQWEVYDINKIHNPGKAIDALRQWMKSEGKDELLIETGIIIAPSYKFQIIRGLITNFHLPESTLLLLVAALIGEEWRSIYEDALQNNFRFLSYGDGSLLLPSL